MPCRSGVWYAKSDMSITEQDLLPRLKRVVDPDIGEDIITLKMISDIAIDGTTLRLTLQPLSPRDSRMESIANRIREELDDLPISELTVTVGDNLRFSNKEAMEGVKAIIAVGSGKGGVGKSTIAANLAAALALEGNTVGMLDADIYGPSQSKMFAVEGRRLLSDEEKKILPLTNHGVRVISIANLVEDGQALTWRGPILHGTLTQLLNQTSWGALDYMVIDLPPGTGDVQLSLAQLANITGMVMVTTPQDMALADVKRAYTMARKTHTPIIGVVENMSYYQLPDGERDYLFGQGGAKAWAEEVQIPLLGEIPLNKALRVAADEGTPLVVRDGDNAAAQELRSIARRTLWAIAQQAESSLPML